MKNKISFNAKYYTSNSIRRIHFHNSRKAKIDYLLPNSEHENFNHHFGSQDILSKYENVLERANDEMKLKGTAYTAKNQIVEAVVALSEEQAEEVLKNGGYDDINKAFIALAEQVKKEHGFEPLEISFHVDEGHKRGSVKRNYHAHITFFNFDFEKKKTPLRGMKKADWANCQNISGQVFAHLGFERGEKGSKDKHQEKELYVLEKEKRADLELKIKSLEKNNKIEKERKERAYKKVEEAEKDTKLYSELYSKMHTELESFKKYQKGKDKDIDD